MIQSPGNINGLKSIASHLHQQLYCFLLSLRTLFMRKVYRRKEGNSKVSGGVGGLCFKALSSSTAVIQSPVNINGCDSEPCQHQRMWFKALSTPTGVKSIVLPPSPPAPFTVSFLPSVYFSYEKLFIRKAYGRKEGNSKDTTGGGGMWFKVLCKHLAHHFHQHLYCFLFSFCTLFTQYVNRIEGRKKTVRILV